MVGDAYRLHVHGLASNCHKPTSLTCHTHRRRRIRGGYILKCVLPTSPSHSVAKIEIVIGEYAAIPIAWLQSLIFLDVNSAPHMPQNEG